MTGFIVFYSEGKFRESINDAELLGIIDRPIRVVTHKFF